jgi:hypothetical protein
METIKLQQANLVVGTDGRPEVVPGKMDTTYILRSREDVSEFLAGRPDADMEITWVCVECHSLNRETHHSRSSRCGCCGKTNFPAVLLPMIGNAETMSKRSLLAGRLKELKEHTEADLRAIANYEEEIDDARIRIKMRKDEMEKYTAALEMTK